MTKNINVVDEHGKKYGTTYLRRAKGLVKQGRARFIKPDMLCLACPPEQNLEDKNMGSENIKTEYMTAGSEALVSEGPEAQDTASSRYTMEYCLEQIERIGLQTEYLNQVISELRQMEVDNDITCTKATALSDIVKCRETTNQQMLRFYEKMYEDLRGPEAINAVSQKAKLQEQLLKIMDKTLENGDFSSNEISDMFNGAYDAIRHIND